MVHLYSAFNLSKALYRDSAVHSPIHTPMVVETMQGTNLLTGSSYNSSLDWLVWLTDAPLLVLKRRTYQLSFHLIMWRWCDSQPRGFLQEGLPPQTSSVSSFISSFKNDSRLRAALPACGPCGYLVCSKRTNLKERSLFSVCFLNL